MMTLGGRMMNVVNTLSFSVRLAMRQVVTALNAVASAGESGLGNLRLRRQLTAWRKSYDDKSGPCLLDNEYQVYDSAIRVIRTFVEECQTDDKVNRNAMRAEACRQIARLDSLKEKAQT